MGGRKDLAVVAVFLVGGSGSPANVIKKLLNRININVWRLKFSAFDNFRLAKS